MIVTKIRVNGLDGMAANLHQNMRYGYWARVRATTSPFNIGVDHVASRRSKTVRDVTK
jgi:hypothetical protein